MNSGVSLKNAQKFFLQGIVIGGLYLVLAHLGRFTVESPGNLVAAWPAAGLAFAAVWWRGYWLATVAGLAAFVFLRVNGASVGVSAGFALIKVMQCLLAAFLVRRFIVGPRLFDRVRDVLVFFFLAGVVAPALSVALGSLGLSWLGSSQWEDFSRLWGRWWLTEMMGVMVVAPVFLAWTWPDQIRWTAHRRAEAMLAFAALTASCALFFMMEPALSQNWLLPAFPIFLLLLWVGLRMGQRLTACASLLVCAFAVWGAVRRSGSVVAALEMPLPPAQTFVVALTLTGLVMVAEATERKEAAEVVGRSEARAAAVLETAFDAILSIDHRGAVCEWNCAAQRMFQYEQGDAVGRSLDDLIVPAELREHYLPRLADYLTTGAGSLIGQPIELMLRRADGREIPAELVIRRIPSSEPPVYTLLIRDLTQRRQTEKTVLQREAQLRSIFEAAPNGIIVVNVGGRIESINGQIEKLFGYRREELHGQPVEILIPERYHAKHWQWREAFLASPESRAMGQGRDLFGRRKDGSEFPVEIGLNAIPMPEACSVLASVVDITGRKSAEEALRQSEAHFRMLAEGLPQLVWTRRPDGTREYISPQWMLYTGQSEAELLRSSPIDLLHQDDREPTLAAWNHALETGDPFSVEFRIRRADGEYRWFRALGRALRDDQGRIVKWIGVNTDIDEQKRARSNLETEIQRRTSQLQASFNSVEELLYTIAHDLRSPNRAMQGFAHLLQLEYRDRLDDRARDYLDRISAAAVRNDQLIRDLLTYGRIAHESIPLAPIDLMLCVEAVLHTLEKEIQQRQARVHVGQTWPRVLANESMLKQILTNLLANALQYVPAERTPEISVSARRDDDITVLRIQDNGIGIPPDQISRAFLPFVRLPNPIAGQGAGMGLAIVKKAAERMGGQVGATAEPGQGSCFWLKLPTA